MIADEFDFDRPFEFLEPRDLTDAELLLVLMEKWPADPIKRFVPSYCFEMRVASRPGVRAGHVNFRPGNNQAIEMVVGHFGYSVEESFRGNHLAERGVRLLFPLARQHGF